MGGCRLSGRGRTCPQRDRRSLKDDIQLAIIPTLTVLPVRRKKEEGPTHYYTVPHFETPDVHPPPYWGAWTAPATRDPRLDDPRPDTRPRQTRPRRLDPYPPMRRPNTPSAVMSPAYLHQMVHAERSQRLATEVALEAAEARLAALREIGRGRGRGRRPRN